MSENRDLFSKISSQNESMQADSDEIQFDQALEQEIQSAGGEANIPNDGRVGVTMFDATGSKDNLLTVVVPKKNLSKLPSQALVRICSPKPEDGGDGRVYQAIVVQGPFYEPDGLRADSSIITTTAANEVMFLPKYHGRVMVEIIGELLDGALVPQRFRPLPNSPVYPLNLEETVEALKLDGDIVLGCAIGHEKMEVKIPSDKKSVLPRHLGILGTTGGGKSTTVSGLVNHLQQSGIATILVDTEGEYTHINQPTTDPNMLNALNRRGLQPEGVQNTKILHLVGRDSTNEDHADVQEFTLNFDELSPYAVMEILDFTEAQQQRYLKAIDIGRVVLRRFGIFPVTDEEKAMLYELDELETGYPKLTLEIMYDIVSLCAKKSGKEKVQDENGKFTFYLRSPKLKGKEGDLWSIIEQEGDLPGNVASWRAIQGMLSQFLRLKIFDNSNAKPFDYSDLTTPGKVSIIDLSDTDSPKIRNLVIAELLRGLMEIQNINNDPKNTGAKEPTRVMVIIEEAHEFLSSQRIKQMPTLYDQVARIAKRGRKRWLGLGFVTQLPQHLPDEVLALINNFILHKISDAGVISRLKRSVGGVDESMWDKLTNLSSGQAVVTLSHMRRAMLTAIDPTPCRLLMVD
ncbi:MAG: ATP-binding protein [Haliscomenobacteraceae bacterium CHB4]|nr:ATP-binding protein [Haliscomenobacteraceae bacterium CHB4]